MGGGNWVGPAFPTVSFFTPKPRFPFFPSLPLAFQKKAEVLKLTTQHPQGPRLFVPFAFLADDSLFFLPLGWAPPGTISMAMSGPTSFSKKLLPFPLLFPPQRYFGGIIRLFCSRKLPGNLPPFFLLSFPATIEKARKAYLFCLPHLFE